MRSVPALNAVGDLVLTDHPEAMRVLAAPLSLSLHDELRRGGPATAAELAGRIQADPDTTQERLRQLEAVGLVTSGKPVADQDQARGTHRAKACSSRSPTTRRAQRRRGC